MDGLEPMVGQLESGAASLQECLASHPHLSHSHQLALAFAEQRGRAVLGLPADPSRYRRLMTWLVAEPDRERELVLAEFRLRLGSMPLPALLTQFQSSLMGHDRAVFRELEEIGLQWDLQPLDDDAFDQFCDQFEDRLSTGNCGSIESQLARVPQASREKTLRELLRIEAYHIRLQGKEIPWDDYRVRFPGDRMTIDEVFRSDCGDRTPRASTHASMGDGMPESSSPEGAPGYRVGQSVAGFKLLKEIGRGGFGQVFAGEDSTLRRKVAVKILRSQVVASPEVRDLFLKESQSLAAVSNDHVVPIYQAGIDRDNLFLVMPLLVGETLQSKLDREGIVPLAEFLRIAKEAATGLQAIHAKGLVHRDLKPANLWMEMGSGRVKILDLGLAQSVMEHQEGICAGTGGYMSPEQVCGEAIDFRSDLFSLGAILYECLTANRAFPGKRSKERIDAVLHAVPVPIQQANPAVPLEICSLIDSLLQKDRQKRPDSVDAVLESLLRVSRITEPALEPSTTPPSHRRLTPPIVAALLALVPMLGLWSWRSFKSGGGARYDILQANAEVESAPIRIESMEVTPLEILPGGKARVLDSLSKGRTSPVTTQHAIEVAAKLSRPAYGYILLYRSDGEQVLLYPSQKDDEPGSSLEFRYPPAGKDVAYQLNDGAGVWLAAVIASDRPLPSFQEWQTSHPAAPWTAQPDPELLSGVVIDDGIQWIAPGQGGTSRGGRGEILVTRVPIKRLVDYWKQEAKATVKVVAFPVVEQ